MTTALKGMRESDYATSSTSIRQQSASGLAMRLRILASFALVFTFIVPPATAEDSSGLALFVSVVQDDVASISRILAAGVNPNYSGGTGITPLFVAAMRGHASAVDTLIGAGADPNFLNYRDRNREFADGVTALHVAAKWGHQDAIVSLLAGGADPNAQSSRSHYTPLHEAALIGDISAVNTLLAAGADPNLTSRWGSTPLHAAAHPAPEVAWEGHFLVINALLAAGADPNMRKEPDPLNERGNDALDTFVGALLMGRWYPEERAGAQ